MRPVRRPANGASLPARIAAVSVSVAAVAGCAVAGGAPRNGTASQSRDSRPALVRAAALTGHRTTTAARPLAGLVRPAALAPPASTTAATEPAASATAGAKPAASITARAKKGVSAWSFNGVRKALAATGASWYYTWSSAHGGIRTPRGVKFVPMIWGSGSISPATLRQARHQGHILLGFNEPDMSNQSNMTVSQALRLWPKLMGTRMRLGSPAVATGAATPGGWLDRFMRGAHARGYRVSFIAVHWYGGDFATRPAVRQLKSYLRQIHARYHKPIWLTEFALANFGAQPRFPSQRLQAAFVRASIAMLDRLSYVRRYAWFTLPVSATGGSMGLFRGGPVATRVGRAFESAP